MFTATYLIAGALRPGYDWLRQPISALSLGPGGGVQITDFVVFGVLGCLTAFAWRPTLTPGIGAVWIPRLVLLAAVALICTGVFTQDPALGFPGGVPSLATPSIHALIHILVSSLSLATTIAGLLLLARRFTREPHWRGWGTAAALAGVLMMAFLATFVALITHAGPGGVFEKLAALIPTLFGLALTTRLLRARDARITRLWSPPHGSCPRTRRWRVVRPARVPARCACRRAGRAGRRCRRPVDPCPRASCRFPSCPYDAG